MARPKRLPEDRVVTAVRLPRDLHRRLQETADERATSVTHLIIKATERFLEHLPPIEPSPWEKEPARETKESLSR